MRLTASIVIPAWNEWELTRACLETLRPTLRLRDEVIVVDNGSTDDTAAGLRRYPWVKVVNHPENLGFAAGCNSGAAVATGDVVVFLNNDTLLPSRWLDGLLAPFSNPAVGATGPRSNFVSGPQLVSSVPYDAGRTADLQRFARGWREEHRGQVTEVNRLVGFCLAVPRDLLTELGGFDEGFGIGGAEDDDLCLRIADAGRTLLIAHESYVHHHGHRTFVANGVDWFALQTSNLERLASKRGEAGRAADDQSVLLSACLIVKDEEESLGDCLSSLAGLVDEIVVYDTGSTDGTVAVARAAGAVVVEGYWDDDFSRARNASLEHCAGEWILHVDADEVVDDAAGVAQQLREQLLHTAENVLTVQIANLADDDVIGITHTGARLFRRERALWSGTLHEQLVSRTGEGLTHGQSSLHLTHFGYRTTVMESRAKLERNVAVAQQGVAATQGQDARAHVNLGRALMADGRDGDALDHYETALSLTENRGVLRQAWKHGAEALMTLGRSAEALTWIEGLRTVTDHSSMADYLAGRAHLNLLHLDEAVACLEGLEDVRDEDVTVPLVAVDLPLGLALSASGRWTKAAAALTRVADGRNVSLDVWAPLTESTWRSGGSLEAVTAVLPEEQTLTALGQVLNASPEAAEALAEQLWAESRATVAVVAFLLKLAPRLPLRNVLEWSGRFRSRGMIDQCPLAALATSAESPPLERVRACATLVGGFDDPRGRGALQSAARAVPVTEFAGALLALDELCPDLLPAFVLAAASTTDRTVTLADVLRGFGAKEQADALLAAGAA